ncbi:unnamed protein product [Closterium sp. NIES-53]
MCIKLEASAHEAWKRLETIHVNKTLHGKILARNAFYTVKMRAGESMHEYATRVEELGETFMDLGGTVTEEDWILTLLCGLPEEWSTVITTLDSVQDTWTKEMVVGRLLHEESRRRQFANESVETAMYSGGSSGKKSKWSKGSTKKSSATHGSSILASLLNNIGAPGDVTSIVFGNNESLPVVGVGSTRLIVDSGPVDVTNVLHVPGVKVNLLSVPQLAKKGVIATIDGAKMNLFWKGEQFAQGVLNGDIYQLKTYPRAASSNVAQGSKATLKAWHNRLAHANYESVKELANKGLAKGVDVIAGDDEKGVCVACLEGKMARKPFGNRTSPLAKDPLAKGDAAKAIQEWALEVCDDDKKRIKCIRTDGGGKFVNAELEKWMKSKGIKHDVTTPYTPQQNGAAERLNRTLVEAVRSLLQHSKLGNEWWGEASALAAWIRNRLPTKVLLGTTPFEAWTRTKPNHSLLRTFGCLCYYHVPDPLRHKLQPKARAAIFLGVAPNERAWRVWDLGDKCIVTAARASRCPAATRTAARASRPAARKSRPAAACESRPVKV